MGRDDRRPWRPDFYNRGYEYLELDLGGEKGRFKGHASSVSSPLERFYQYNHPTAPQDTFFLRYGGRKTNYRAYVR